MNKSHSSRKEYFIPSVCFLDGRISSVSTDFITLTGYEEKNIIGLNMKEFSSLLRIISNTPLIDINVANDAFIYSSTLHPIEVTIVKKIPNINSTEIMFIFAERESHKNIDNILFAKELLNTNTVGVCIFKVPELIMIEANDAFFKCLEKPYNTRYAAIGKCFSEAIRNWDNSDPKKQWENLLKTGNSLYIDDYKYDFLDGEKHWNTTLAPIYLNKKLTYYVQIISDITEETLNRKRIEHQNSIITEQKNQLDSIINNVSDALIMVDKDYKLYPLNAAAKETIPENTFSNHISDVFKDTLFYDINGNTIPQENLPIYSVIRGETINNIPLVINFPGKTLNVSVSGNPVCDYKGDFQYGIICIRNLEDIIKYELELKNKHINLFTMLDNLHLPILKLSYPALAIKQINKKAIDEFKYFNLISEFETDFEKRKIKEIIPQIEFETCPGLMELTNRKSTVKINNYEINLSDKKRNFNVIMQPLLNTQGDIENIIVVLYDISDEVAQQNKLMEILRLQEEFFSYISHEFKTPITVINASVQALQLMYKNEMTDKVSMYVNKIKKSSLQQLRLVNNLLDIIKADSGYLKLDTRYVDIVSLLKSITDSVSPIARQNGINLYFSSIEKTKFIHVDDAKLERILLNLLSNALKFTPSGKSIYVSLDIKETNYIVEVLDEGPGIPKDKQKLIFEKYGQLGDSLTRTSEGTGIGLCLVNKLVQTLQGNLILESHPGVGSSFKVILPIIDEPVMFETSLHSDTIEDRLIQTMKVEFSDIYLSQ